MKFRHSALAVLLLLAPMQASAQAPTIPDQATQTMLAGEITAFRQSVLALVKAKDAARLEAVYAPAFMQIHTNGYEERREQRVRSLLDGAIAIEGIAIDGLTVRTPSTATAIVSGASPFKSDKDGRMYAVFWSVTYVKTAAGWLIAGSQLSQGNEIK